MTSQETMKAYLFGLVDRRVEEVFEACAVQTIRCSTADLLALANASSSQPDVLVLDLRDGSAIPPSVATLKRQHPTTGVLILASRLDPAVMLEAMRAGVNEFVTEPLSVNDVRAAIDRVTAARQLPETGKVFAFVGGKGGVGTTTLAVNVAAVLATTRASVLLLDLHIVYGDAALFLGVEPRFSVADALENIDRIDEAFLSGIVAHSKLGLDVLASSDRAMAGRLEVRALRRLLDCASRQYQFVVVDVPQSDPAILDCLDNAAKIVVVANQELATVRSAGRMVTALRQRYGKSTVHVVVSRYDQHAEIGRADVERVMGSPVWDVFPSNYRLALEALNRGRPFVLDNHSKLANSYTTFARRLVGTGVNEPAQADRATTGLLSRLSLRL